MSIEAFICAKCGHIITNLKEYLCTAVPCVDLPSVCNNVSKMYPHDIDNSLSEYNKYVLNTIHGILRYCVLYYLSLNYCNRESTRTGT